MIGVQRPCKGEPRVEPVVAAEPVEGGQKGVPGIEIDFDLIVKKSRRIHECDIITIRVTVQYNFAMHKIGATKITLARETRVNSYSERDRVLGMNERGAR